MKLITSSSNRLLKEVKSLKQRKYREQKGLFFVEGYRIVKEAAEYEGQIASVFVSEGFKRADTSEFDLLLKKIEEKGCNTFLLPDSLYREISDTDNPQGIMAVMHIKVKSIEEIMGGDRLFILLESLKDPGNMGTIIRTADAAGFNGVIISEGCVDIYNPKVLRATMGSIFRVPVIPVQSVFEAITFFKKHGLNIYSAHLQGSRNYFDLDMRCNTVLIIGNEANGITSQTATNTDILIRIPMKEGAESLNASVAASILMYECVRQKIK
jgi:TrmH family RNA methyltransferase